MNPASPTSMNAIPYARANIRSFMVIPPIVNRFPIDAASRHVPKLHGRRDLLPPIAEYSKRQQDYESDLRTIGELTMYRKCGSVFFAAALAWLPALACATEG